MARGARLCGSSVRALSVLHRESVLGGGQTGFERRVQCRSRLCVAQRGTYKDASYRSCDPIHAKPLREAVNARIASQHDQRKFRVGARLEPGRAL